MRRPGGRWVAGFGRRGATPACTQRLLLAPPPALGCRNLAIALTFGPGHTCGRRPERVANVMKAYVEDQSQAFPECFGGEAPPDPPGSWTNPHIIQAIPFTSDLLSVSTAVPHFAVI